MRSGESSAVRQTAGERQIGHVATIVRTAAYVRVSTEEQARSGLGLAAQLARCVAMTTVKDWPQPRVFADEGISGTKDTRRRPGLAQLMDAVSAGEVDAVIINSLDRLGRKTRLVLELVDEFNRYGVSLVSCKESLDTTTAQGQFVLTLFAALAQLERDLIADRTRAALAAKGIKDGEKGGKFPFGYVRTPLGPRLDRAAAATVRCMFDWRAEGFSLRRIAEHLDRRHPLDGGRRWQHTSVREILGNEVIYRGGRRGESALRWPAILGSECAVGKESDP